MKKKISILFFSFLFNYLNAQSNSNLINLSPLKNSKIVLLGEQTHFDGAVFDKKVEIIKKLHKDLGFNIVVFESGMYDNYKALQLYKSKKESIAIYNQSIFSMWTETSAFKELLEYVSKHPEMKILGFDNQETSFFKEFFIADLKKLLTKNKINLSNKTYTTIEKTLVYRDLDFYINNKKDSLNLYRTFNKIKTHISKIDNKNLDAKIIEQTFKSSIADFDFSLKIVQKEKVYIQNPRDKQMAENLIFLQNQFPYEKIIGWGASYHFANKLNTFNYTTTTENYITKQHKLTKKLTSHNHSTLKESINSIKELQYAIPMGKLLKEYYKDKLYSIGFTSYSGNYFGSDKIDFPILKPPTNSIETLFFEKKYKSKLIDKKEYPSNNFYTSALGYLPIYGNWSTIFDGIYYIPKMYPPKYRTYRDTNKTIRVNKTKLEGVVIESETNSPIPYTDVYYTANNKSTVTNNIGEFSIKKNINANDYLVFSSFGYKSDSIQIKTINSRKPIEVILQKSKETHNILNEVVLRNTKTLSAKEILKRAKKRVKNNYVQTPFNQKFFYKTQQLKKDSLLYNEEAVIETFFKKGNNGTNNPENNIFGNILQLRNTTNNFNRNKESGIGNLWFVIIKDVILSKTNVLYRSSSYKLKKEGIIKYNGKDVYKISFINDSPGAYSTGYGYPAPISSNGIIYIDKKSFAVLYYEHCVVREVQNSKRSKHKIQTFHKIVQTYKEVNGQYFSNLFKVIDKFNYYSKSDNVLLDSYYHVNSLMSTDIEIMNVKTIERPIWNLKQKIKADFKTDFWKKNSFYIEDNNYKFENCD